MRPSEKLGCYKSEMPKREISLLRLVNPNASIRKTGWETPSRFWLAIGNDTLSNFDNNLG